MQVLPRCWALVPLRVLVGIGFILHGYAKLARGPAHFADVVATLGVPAPTMAAYLTIAVELVGGLAILAGGFVRATSVVLAAVMVTAIAGVHWPYGFSSVRLVALTEHGAQFGPVGYELPLLYIAALAALAISQPTPWSLDAWRVRGGAAGSVR